MPFDAVTTFFDPSVQFGLKFETQDAPEDAGTQPEAETADASTPLPAKVLPAAVPATKAKPVEAEIAGADKDAAADEGDSDSRGTAEVVSLDSFRKKT